MKLDKYNIKYVLKHIQIWKSLMVYIYVFMTSGIFENGCYDYCLPVPSDPPSYLRVMGI